MKIPRRKRLLYAWKDRHEPEEEHVLGSAVWKFSLVLVVVVVISSVLYKMVIFASSAPTEDQILGGLEADTLSIEALERALSSFEARTVQYEYLKNNPPRIGSPS